MAGGMTKPHQDAFLNHAFGRSAYTPVGLHLAFCTSNPGESGTPSGEPAGSSRTAIAFSAAASGTAGNSGQLTISTTGWTDTSDLTHFALANAASAGSFLWTGQLQSPISFTAGQDITVAIGAIDVELYDTPSGSNNLKVTVAGANLWLDHSLNTTPWTMPTTVEASCHTAQPASAVNEFSLGDYAAQTFGASAPGTSGDASTITHAGGLTWGTNIQDSPLNGWAIKVNGPVYVFERAQSQTVLPGSTLDVGAGTLITTVD